MEPDRQPALLELVPLLLGGVGETREDPQPARRQPIDMAPGQEVAAPQLEDLERAKGPGAFPARLEDDDGVRDREFGYLAELVPLVLPDPERVDGQRAQPPGQVDDEPAVLDGDGSAAA